MKEKELNAPDRGRVRRKILSVLVALAGLILMLYPWISNRLYENAAESTVSAYDAAVDFSASESMEMYRQEAQIYNERLLRSDIVLTDPFTCRSSVAADTDLDYASVLDVDGTGVMCFVEIPVIDVYLPVYHGTSAEMLEKGAGHVEGTALPIGTEGARPVIAAHTGVNTAKMFSDLTLMEDGDLFFIHVLDETLAYRVMEIRVVEPDDVSGVCPVEGEDLVTLMTCTPYGINSHRLLVTGERTEYTEDVRKEALSQNTGQSSEWMKAYRRALLAGLGVLAVVFLAAAIRRMREMHRY
ncbi:MAG: class C sortase [Clostridiales bacterium]|nr:class C sortase [Clostridiales bacterium]